MSDSLRDPLRAIAVKQEATAGTDVFNGTVTLADFVGADFSYTIKQDNMDSMEVNGSLDESNPILGQLRATVEIRCYLRGTGAAGTAPEVGKLLQACGMVETITAATVGVPTAATAGTATSVTAATPFAATAQLYRGMPLLITGTPVAATLITDYTVARVASLVETFSPALTTTALLQIPINVLYSPGTDYTAMKPVTVYLYEAGLRHRFVGMVGTVRLEMMAGKVAVLTFSLRGQVRDAHQPSALITGWNTISRQSPPLWLGGKSQLNRGTAKTDSFKWDLGAQIYEPDNPEAPQGFDPGTITSRKMRADIAPFANTSAAAARFAAMTAGTSAVYGAMLGSTAGNRFGITMPSSRIMSMDRTARADLGADALSLQPDLADAGFYLASF